MEGPTKCLVVYNSAPYSLYGKLAPVCYGDPSKCGKVCNNSIGSGEENPPGGTDPGTCPGGKCSTLAASCTAKSTSIKLGERAIYKVTVSGGTAPYQNRAIFDGEN